MSETQDECSPGSHCYAVDQLQHVVQALPIVVERFEFMKGLLSVWGRIDGVMYHVSKWVPQGDWDAVISDADQPGSYSGKWCSRITGNLRVKA